MPRARSVIDARLSDHLPQLFSVQGAEVLSWNILARCAVRAFGPNNGFNINEDRSAYETRLHSVGSLLAQFFAEGTPLSGVALLQEAPAESHQQLLLLQAARAGGCRVESRVKVLSGNMAVMTLWDAERWCLSSEESTSSFDFADRSLGTMFKTMLPGPSTLKGGLGLINLHLKWVSDAETDPARYARHCAATAASLSKALSSWPAPVAAAMGDFNLRVGDVAAAAKQQCLPLRAELVEGSSQSWKKGGPCIETVDGVITVER